MDDFSPAQRTVQTLSCMYRKATSLKQRECSYTSSEPATQSRIQTAQGTAQMMIGHTREEELHSS